MPVLVAQRVEVGIAKGHHRVVDECTISPAAVILATDSGVAYDLQERRP